MKLASFLILFIISIGAKAQAPTAPPIMINPTADSGPLGLPLKISKDLLPDPLKLSTSTYDFGSIAYGKQVFTTFTIKNTGKTPLAIGNIATSCGCTTPEYNKDPIAPNEERTVKVGFNGYAEGAFSKTVTISYLEGKTQTFTIKGTGIKAPDVASKPNAALNILRQSF